MSIEIVLLVVLGLGAVSALITSYIIRLEKEDRELQKQLMETYRIMERNPKVYKYRKQVLNRSLEDWEKLPSYQEMVESELPLTDEYWL
jgi:hypothetical protein